MWLHICSPRSKGIFKTWYCGSSPKQFVNWKHSRKLRLWSRKLCGSPRGAWGLRQAVLKGILHICCVCLCLVCSYLAYVNACVFVFVDVYCCVCVLKITCTCMCACISIYIRLCVHGRRFVKVMTENKKTFSVRWVTGNTIPGAGSWCIRKTSWVSHATIFNYFSQKHIHPRQWRFIARFAQWSIVLSLCSTEDVFFDDSQVVQFCCDDQKRFIRKVLSLQVFFPILTRKPTRFQTLSLVACSSKLGKSLKRCFRLMF